MWEPRKLSRCPQLAAMSLGKAASRVPGQGLGPGHLVHLAGRDVTLHPSSICLPLPPTHPGWVSMTYLAQMCLLLESLQELGVMLLVHQLLLDGLGVLGQGL